MDPLISLVVGFVAFVMLDALAIAILLVLAPVALAIRDGVGSLFRRESRQPVAAATQRARRPGLASEPR